MHSYGNPHPFAPINTADMFICMFQHVLIYVNNAPEPPGISIRALNM